jgi:hypothetical protein
MGPDVMRLVAGAAWAPVLVLVLHLALDLGFRAYDERPWLDGPMHVAGGIAVAYAMATLLDTVNRGDSCPQQVLLDRVLTITSVAAVAVLWELAEFVVDRTAGTNLQVSLPNTMKDLALGLLGAVLLVATRRPTRPGPACV